ncbi:MAG TPA: YkgJ family cysteine cluster protein [Pseudacidobacterium sp.]|nr:YkgJ family cysteine cluster protein [Pseudacidobacterium sp.]
MLPQGDQRLVQIVDAALADTARRSGPWLACRPGCTQCCIGAFAISQLDAERLRAGFQALEQFNPERAARVLERVRQSIARIANGFPGDTKTGILDDSPEAEDLFAEFANDEHCPVLDPETGMCDLYDARPMTCRVFGPPVRSEGGLGVCELCYHGASETEIAACEMHLETDELETELTSQIERQGNTVVAFALRS